MKRYVRSSTGYNISWYTQDGRQCGEYVEVPSNTDAYNYIERYLQHTYGDDFGGIADYISEYDDIDADTITCMTEDELNQAILDGRPFDIDTFNKYKIDPYRAKGAVKSADLEVGDIIRVTEDASEIDCPSPEIEIMNIRYDDPDEYGHDCITFYCYDNETGDDYTLHFWPDEWVGPIIAKKSNYSIKSTASFDSSSNQSKACSSTQIRRYSDVRPYEDRRYWYFTTHGVGPGTIPSDLNVLEVREGQNDKGTWGDFVCLDGVLNTDELSYYDLRELAPDNIISDTEVDENDEWSPYRKGIYRVDGRTIYYTNDPEDAIETWFKMQKDAWLDVAIFCKTRDQALAVCKAATPELLTELFDKYEQPYKLEYLIDDARKAVENGCKYFHEDDYGYGDQVHPFDVG